MKRYYKNIIDHYTSVWRTVPNVKPPALGPMEHLDSEFCILEFPPSSHRNMWTYATCGMSNCPGKLELHLFAPSACDDHIETLTAVSHYHRTERILTAGNTINIGRPWIRDSLCSYGLLSLPYLDGPALENYVCCDDTGISWPVQFLWLIPITHQEKDFGSKYGIHELEEKFEKIQVNYIDPSRASVV